MREVVFFFTLAFFVGASILMTAQTGFCKDIVGVIVVDMQGDFTTLKNGSLAVKGTDKAFVEQVQKVTEALKQKGFTIFATQDWHPKDHISFHTNHEGEKAFRGYPDRGQDSGALAAALRSGNG